jgi:hypothetical protein
VAVTVTLRALGDKLLPGVALEGVVPALLMQFAGQAAEPARFGARLLEEYALPWLFVGLGPLLALLPGGGLPPWTRAVVAANGVGGAILVATYLPLSGQYGLILCPALVLGAAQALSALGTGRLRALALPGLLAASVLLAVPLRARLAHDPDRAWAQAVGHLLGESDVVICMGRGRKLRVEEHSAARAVDFSPAGDAGGGDLESAVLDAVEQRQVQGGTVFLDPLILTESLRFPTLRPVVAAIESQLELVPLEGAQLLAARIP